MRPAVVESHRDSQALSPESARRRRPAPSLVARTIPFEQAAQTDRGLEAGAGKPLLSVSA
ncbi:hypothetical protein ASE02_21315 [Phenylobacterium sp. Root700]|nr:hypothetical protein ASE02_21315 [Phenylobacterium sp. Root700]